jgi:hypothetical protein
MEAKFALFTGMNHDKKPSGAAYVEGAQVNLYLCTFVVIQAFERVF